MAELLGFRSVVLPPHVRDSLLDAGPGRYGWQGRTLVVLKLGRKTLTIVELDADEQPAKAGRASSSSTWPKVPVGAALTAGTLAMVAMLGAENDAQRALLFCASAIAFITATVTAVFGSSPRAPQRGSPQPRPKMKTPAGKNGASEIRS